MRAHDERIDVSLVCSTDRVTDVHVDSSRVPLAVRALEGRSVAEALALCPLVFPVCGAAHATALIRAVEDARGHAPSPRVRLARELLLSAERATSDATAIVLSFAEALGSAPAEVGALKALRAGAAALARGFGPGVVGSGAGPLRVPATLRDDAARFAEACRSVLGGCPVEAAAFEGWARAGGSPAARVIAAAADPELEAVGQAGAAPLGALPAATLTALLRDDAAIARPTVQGAPRDPSTLHRLAEEPLIAALRARHGDGLVSRLAARLVSLGKEADACEDLASRLLADTADASDQVTTAEPGEGIGVALTARGPLAYLVRVEDDRVVFVRSVAPTEWAFHPEGPLASLVGLPRDCAERAGRLLVCALDPCVPARVRTVTPEEVAHA